MCVCAYITFAMDRSGFGDIPGLGHGLGLGLGVWLGIMQVYAHMHMHMRMHMNMNANRTPTCMSAIDSGDEENSYVCSRWMDGEDGVASSSRETLPGPRSNDDVSGRLSTKYRVLRGPNG